MSHFHPDSRSEEIVSHGLFVAAHADPTTAILSWQGVDGKSYFAADIKLRLPNGLRMEPDLIILESERIWLMEIKSLHSQSLDDEMKLGRLFEETGEDGILRTISILTGIDVAEKKLVPCVAYDIDDVLSEENCTPFIVHLEWSVVEPTITMNRFRDVLVRLGK